MTSKVPRRALEHPPRGHPEYEGDSNRAADHAALVGRHWIDYNALLDAHGQVVNTHYPYPLRHGFEDPAGELKHSPIDRMTEAEWRRLRTRRGDPAYRIRLMSERIDYALSKGVNVEIDLKCDIPAATLRPLIDGRTQRVQVKTMATLRTTPPWERLKHAKQAGATTILLCHRPLIRVPKAYRQFIDYYRGFRPWWV